MPYAVSLGDLFRSPGSWRSLRSLFLRPSRGSVASPGNGIISKSIFGCLRRLARSPRATGATRSVGPLSRGFRPSAAIVWRQTKTRPRDAGQALRNALCHSHSWSRPWLLLLRRADSVRQSPGSWFGAASSHRVSAMRCPLCTACAVVSRRHNHTSTSGLQPQSRPETHLLIRDVVSDPLVPFNSPQRASFPEVSAGRTLQ